MIDPHDKVAGRPRVERSARPTRPHPCSRMNCTISSRPRTSPDEEDPLAALRDDPNYSALIKELEYIAAQARALFSPAEEAPSDEVWNKIRKELPARPDEA